MKRLKKIAILFLLSLSSLSFADKVQWKYGGKAFSKDHNTLIEKRYQEFGDFVPSVQLNVDGKSSTVDYGKKHLKMVSTNGELDKYLPLTRELIKDPSEDCRNQAFWDKLSQESERKALRGK